MININVPNSAWSTTEMSLGGIQYTFKFRYNNRDSRWRLDIYSLGDPVVLGVKLMENQNLLEHHYLPRFLRGHLFCIRSKKDGKVCTRDNVGIDKPYELLYLSNTEVGALSDG